MLWMRIFHIFSSSAMKGEQLIQGPRHRTPKVLRFSLLNTKHLLQMHGKVKAVDVM